MTFKKLMLTLVLCFLTKVTLADQTETQKIGKMVQQLQIAIQSPDSATSLKTIYLYGADKRYYPMIRGWLFQELVEVENKLYASKTVSQAEKFQHHSNFLKQAIRSID